MPSRKQNTSIAIKAAAPLGRAAAYVRMSTENQEFSPHNQMMLIRKYAADHELSIVRTYSDEGISGLRIENRPGLNALLAEIISGRADFSKLLVYDVSRWGRFQDVDEGAHYEFLCRQSGVDVIYCAEHFVPGNSLVSAIQKVISRGAAAKWSQDLSVKCFEGQRNIVVRGFSAGAIPPFGLRAVLVDSSGKRLGRLIPADRKTHRNCRLSLAPGPAHEVRVVREIFRRYVDLRESPTQITRFLNASGILNRRGSKWQLKTVIRMLGNEKYVGTQVFNKVSQKMGTKIRHNPPSEWIRTPNAFPGIIDHKIFQKAQERLRKPLWPEISNVELLDMLRRLLARRGRLTARVINRERAMPWACMFSRRFGSLFNAYQLIGYRGGSHYAREKLRRRHLRIALLERMKGMVESAGFAFEGDARGSWFRVGGSLTCSLQLMAYCQRRTRVSWYRHQQEFVARMAGSSRFQILARLDADQTTIRDFFVVPWDQRYVLPRTFGVRIPPTVDQYRFKALDAAIDHIVRKVNKPQPFRGMMSRH